VTALPNHYPSQRVAETPQAWLADAPAQPSEFWYFYKKWLVTLLGWRADLG
jgi:hypothetical protein